MSTEMALELIRMISILCKTPRWFEGTLVAASAIQVGSTIEDACDLVESQKNIDKFSLAMMMNYPYNTLV